MKKTFLSLSLMMVMLLSGVQQVVASENLPKEEKVFTDDEIQRLKEIESRIFEIREMDFSEMSREEKKDLRSELKDLNKEARQRGGGLYISTGALIIILILLIILL